MGHYAFFLEYDGKKTNARAYDTPVDEVVAPTLQQAVEKFCKKHKLELSHMDPLGDGTYRVYLLKKAFLRGTTEFIYYIEPLPADD